MTCHHCLLEIQLLVKETQICSLPSLYTPNMLQSHYLVSWETDYAFNQCIDVVLLLGMVRILHHPYNYNYVFIASLFAFQRYRNGVWDLCLYTLFSMNHSFISFDLICTLKIHIYQDNIDCNIILWVYIFHDVWRVCK